MFQPLSNLYQFIVENLLGLSMESRIGETLHYFLFTSSEIMILLGVGIFVISVLRTFVSTTKVRDFVEKHDGIKAHLAASLLGVVTPFCSCSSVPLFISFIESRIPLGIVFSFLITSPIVNEAAFIILLSVFGWKVAVLYTISGVTIGIIGGMFIGKLKMERYVQEYIYKMHIDEQEEVRYRGVERIAYAWDEVRSIMKKLVLYILGGIGVGALIHGWVPADLISAVGDSFLAVPLATLAGVPLYIDAAGVIPIAEALLTKGLGIGTTIAFMMAAVALSLPEMVMLKKVIKMPLLSTFVVTVTVGIIIVGYLFNVIPMV